MSGTQVGGIFIGIFANERGHRMSTLATQSLTPAQRCVNAALGIADADVATMIKRHGKGGLAGVALLSEERSTNPYGVKIARIPATNPGWIDDATPGVPVIEIREPDDSDAELVRDPAGLLIKPSRVLFPDGSTNITKRDARKE
jgi:hypothetical protein